MSTNPMDSLKRRPAAPLRKTFPDPLYAQLALEPAANSAWRVLGDAVVGALSAHIIVLAEGRVLKPEIAATALKLLENRPEVDGSADLSHWLATLEALLVDGGAANALLGRGREELAATAQRLVVRERVLALAESVMGVREALARLALGHLTTLVIMTSASQAVQPTTLAHYLLGQLGPLERTSSRLQELYERVDRSPLGAVSGVGTAVPLRRDRAAELLGFAKVVENSFDALASRDVEREALGVVNLQAGEALRFIGDLSFWARDDVGLVVPGDEFVHRSGGQPQRRDPGVLSYLALAFSELAVVQIALPQMSMLGDEMVAQAAAMRVIAVLEQASATLELTQRVVESLVVERAASANRAQRGFPTASELADFFVMDHELSYDQAFRLAEAVVTEALTLNIGAMHLSPDLVDRVALREIGIELGIEVETLSRILAPRPFIERRGDIGGPAPAAVRESLDREALSVRRERAWISEMRARLDQAQEHLQQRRTELATG